MRIFKTLQELVNYIPTCVICQKGMKIAIEGYLGPANSKTKWGGRTEYTYLKLKCENGVLHSKHDGDSITIEAATNKLIDGEDIINRLMLNTINVKKCCSTCVFKIYSTYQSGNTKKAHNFPQLTLRSEELSYTLRGGKRCAVNKYYNFNTNAEDTKCNIVIGGSSLQPILLDFSKFIDLDQINKRIKTIAVFQ